jgi:RNA polymerase sigma-70 factor (ECF subfamily)
MERSAASAAIEGASVAQEFESFFEAERRRLFRALYLMTGDTHEAEELTQDAFLKLWERWERVGAMDDPVGYLYRVAMNLARSRYRRILRAARVPLAWERSVEPYSAADTRDAVVRALAELAPRQRQAVVMAELLDCSAEETADLMHISTSTVRSLVSQARKAMRTAMEQNYE